MLIDQNAGSSMPESVQGDIRELIGGITLSVPVEDDIPELS